MSKFQLRNDIFMYKLAYNIKTQRYFEGRYTGIFKGLNLL